MFLKTLFNQGKIHSESVDIGDAEAGAVNAANAGRESTKSGRARRICSGWLLLAALVVLTGASLAWYGELSEITFGIGGQVTYRTRYFNSGDGTTNVKFTESSASEDERWGNYAYEIATPEQLYNLAWLQYMGYFKGGWKSTFIFQRIWIWTAMSCRPSVRLSIPSRENLTETTIPSVT